MIYQFKVANLYSMKRFKKIIMKIIVIVNLHVLKNKITIMDWTECTFLYRGHNGAHEKN